jgi:glycosyltransferase involved in cell wall biosynthesis
MRGAARVEVATARFPRHVLMTVDPVGGVFTYAVELSRGLGRHGIQVSLATMGGRLRREQAHSLARLGNVTPYESTFQLEWMDQPWRDVARAGEWLTALEARLKPDLVHLNGYAHAALPWRAPVVVVAHSCVLAWWEAVRHGPAPAEWARYREAVGAGLRAADVVVAPTTAVLQDLQRHHGAVPRARVVPNGRDPRAFPVRPKGPFVLCATRLWDEAKNVEALRAVAARLPWPVCVAGAAQSPEGHRVSLDGLWALGALAPAALARWFSRAAIYALPASYEPFGLSALEAGLAGCALVLGDIPSLREVWDDAAAFVDPADRDALTETLQRLIAGEEERARLGERARARALEYSPDRMAEGYLRAYRAAQAEQRAEARAGQEAPLCG